VVNCGDISNENRHTTNVLHYDISDVFKVRHLTGNSNEILTAAFLDVTRTDVCIIGVKRGHDIAQGQPVPNQSVRIGGHVELFLIASDRIDFRDPRSVSELRPNDPFLDGSKVR